MADFCRQCSLDNFGEDYRELAGIGDGDLKPGYGYPAVCEGCGFILVDKDGNCLDCHLRRGKSGHGLGHLPGSR